SPRVSNDFDTGHRDEPLLHHHVEMGNQLFNLLLTVDDSQHHRRILGERPMTGMVNSSAGAVPFDSPVYSGAGHSQFHAFGNNRFMQRLALPFVALAEVNTQHARLKLVSHG